MKIGIITWFKYENYGTKLQAVALQSYLRSQGHDVQLIDFPIPELPGIRRKRSFIKRVYGRLNYMALQYAHKRYIDQFRRKSQRMERVINEQCIVTAPIEDDNDYINTCNQFELIICGSDQIWNPNWYHAYYYADFPGIRVRKISYAPSIGISKIPEDKKDDIRKSLASFSLVTVRENKAASLLEPIIGYKPQIVLDPTMLITKEQWINMFELDIQKEQRYVLCYFLTDNENHWIAARKFSRENSMETRIIPQMGFSYYRKGRKYMDAGVKEFLELIFNAEYVLTDSFHGTVFSLLFEKEVYIFERFKDDQFFSQNDRVRDLVNEFGIKDHLLKYNNKRIEGISKINYTEVDDKLRKLRVQSETILKNEISR